ncbi:uncharacterized protein MYCFIDRAFT_179456 [Pseudocercospora fijiensis CIRAD86]|uniref:Uncharacterized protein n=1 Tax=Pseudocercospora fijiensis (strain CIRAD86) TaxID=383855 RepID=M2ZFT2_PSEFD|nr:uncharacterized protein MYCFIDRAFT_179456 [Pseudocercospora fijiensis CIRAD86]EME78004.1 hypothetical protein MYCFIDRAFT_179456 [Pseudocercospora fijiensis CIRAD86]
MAHRQCHGLGSEQRTASVAISRPVSFVGWSSKVRHCKLSALLVQLSFSKGVRPAPGKRHLCDGLRGGLGPTAFTLLHGTCCGLQLISIWQFLVSDASRVLNPSACSALSNIDTGQIWTWSVLAHVQVRSKLRFEALLALSAGVSIDLTETHRIHWLYLEAATTKLVHCCSKAVMLCSPASKCYSKSHLTSDHWSSNQGRINDARKTLDPSHENALCGEARVRRINHGGGQTQRAHRQVARASRLASVLAYGYKAHRKFLSSEIISVLDTLSSSKQIKVTHSRQRPSSISKHAILLHPRRRYEPGCNTSGTLAFWRQRCCREERCRSRKSAHLTTHTLASSATQKPLADQLYQAACATYCIILAEDPPVFAACVIGCAATGVPETEGLKPKTLEDGTIWESSAVPYSISGEHSTCSRAVPFPARSFVFGVFLGHIGSSKSKFDPLLLLADFAENNDPRQLLLPLTFIAFFFPEMTCTWLSHACDLKMIWFGDRSVVSSGTAKTLDTALDAMALLGKAGREFAKVVRENSFEAQELELRRSRCFAVLGFYATDRVCDGSQVKLEEALRTASELVTRGSKQIECLVENAGKPWGEE